MSQTGINLAHKKSLKKSYKFLTLQEKKLVKILEAYEEAQRFLYSPTGFYATAPRLKNGQINWDLISDLKLNVFEDMNKKIEKYSKYDEKKFY
jgi:hypothetical protein